MAISLEMAISRAITCFSRFSTFNVVFLRAVTRTNKPYIETPLKSAPKLPSKPQNPNRFRPLKNTPPNSSPHDGHPPKIQNLQTYPTKSGIIPIWTSPSSGRSSIWTPPSSEIDSFDPLDSHEIDSFDPLDSQKSMIIAMKSTFIAFKPLNPDLPTEGGGWLVTKQYINCVEFEKNV